MIEPDTLLITARTKFRKALLKNGMRCPCCHRYGKLYKRNINSTMARDLIWLVNAYRQRKVWIDVPAEAPRSVVKTNQLSTLKYWGLVKGRPSIPGKQKSEGYWKPTRTGIKFAFGKVVVPKSAWVYNDKAYRFTGTTTIKDALKTDFDYMEMMKAKLDDERAFDKRKVTK